MLLYKPYSAIHKLGKKSIDLRSYRPINLIPIISKLMEKVILKRLNRHDTSSEIIVDHEFDFIEKHNTIQQTTRIVNNINTIFNKRNKTVLLFLDIEKTFDKVWIDGLIYKMINYKYPCPSDINLLIFK
ncbi:hypothetical protein HZH66_010528 [Vespula vulgaris]|uniref:Reverse transcriptase domain-containing protein n=1 Tax=Vespula vulgaris TaxID=7454 RepID=A0A834JHH6_VESVU|nr:hypothetical protein HZH66_010528 [Vespula vulgaris]